MSVLGEKNRQARRDFCLKNIFRRCRERRDGSDPMKMQIRVWQVLLHKRRMTVGRVTDISRRRFVGSAPSAAALAALPIRSMADARFTTLIPESNDSAAAIRRYQDGYRVAETVVAFSQTVEFGGIFAGGVIFVGGLVEFILNPAEHHGFAVIFLSLFACAVLLILISRALAMGLRGEGQLLKAAIDSDVNSSPFLSNRQRVQAMSLRKREAPKFLPWWPE
jgi:hypothetical protein